MDIIEIKKIIINHQSFIQLKDSQRKMILEPLEKNTSIENIEVLHLWNKFPKDFIDMLYEYNFLI
jgi:hypothetical protein